MKVDETTVRSPTLGDATNLCVVERGGDAEPAPQVVAGSDVVPGENVEPAEATEQHVLRGRPEVVASRLSSSMPTVSVSC